MHIAEGILPAKWAIVWFGVSAPFVAHGIRRLRTQTQQEPFYRPLLGLMTAGVFAISLLPVPVPIAGTSSHMGGTPLAAILLGPSIGSVLGSVALLLQGLFFAHGGLTTLGANVFSQGVAGAFVAYGVFAALRRRNVSWSLAAGLGGFLGDLAIYVITSAQLALAIPGTSTLQLWGLFFLAFMPTQIPLAILEGFITAGVVNYVRAARPDMLWRLAGGERGVR